MLRFLGRGSAFSDEQNCAFFRTETEFVLLDCPMSAFHRLRKFPAEAFRGGICVMVTHTHSDHIGGIPMLIHYAKHLLHIPVTVIVPTEELVGDLRFLIERLDGCKPEDYVLTTAAECGAPWLNTVVPVRHSEGLSGRCFGYVLSVSGQTVVYTGDTAELEPFLPYLSEGAFLYTEAASFDSGVHLFLEKALSTLRQLCASGVRVYLMHLDDEAAIRKIIHCSGIEFAPLLTGNEQITAETLDRTGKNL